MKWQTWKVSIRQKYQSKRPWKVCIFATHRTDRPQTSALFIHFSNTLLDRGLSFYFEYFDLSSKVNLLPYGVDLLKKFRRVVLLCVTEAAPWTPAGHCCLWISEHYHFLLQTPKSNLLSSSSKVSYTVSYTGVASKYWNTLPQKEASAILSALNCLSYNIGDIRKAM